MSPAVAIHDPVFRAYLWLLLGLLLAAGAILALLQFIFRKQLGTIWTTYRSWLVMGPLIALAIFAGRWPFTLTMTLLALVALREFSRVSGLERSMSSTVGLGIVAVACSSFVAQPLTIPALVIALILVLPVLLNRARGAVRQMSLGMIGFLYLGWMFGQLGFLAANAHAYGYLCYLFFATEVNDVAAFSFGKIFGRHPLRSEISPRKTWEGALGALALSLILPWLLHFSFPFFGARQLLLTGLIIGIGGQLGDLSLSLIKRDLGAKDMGSLIPGHGGILDRIDSLIFTAPLFMLMVNYYYPGQ